MAEEIRRTIHPAAEAVAKRFPGATRLSQLSTFQVRDFLEEETVSTGYRAFRPEGRTKAFLTAKSADGKDFLIEVEPAIAWAVGQILATNQEVDEKMRLAAEEAAKAKGEGG